VLEFASYVSSLNSFKRSPSNPKTDCSRCWTTHGLVFLSWMTTRYGNNYHVKANKMQTSYFTGIAMQGMEEEMAVLQRIMSSDSMTADRIRLIDKAYLAKADALELLHSQLGHLPYSHIEMMIRQGIIKGITLDRKTLKALKQERCWVCMRAKGTDAPHNGHIPTASNAWVNFQTALTAMFDQASLCSNNYMMVIIDTKKKYVWDYYHKTKDEAYDTMCKWPEHEIRLHRGRESSNFEITLFSDRGKLTLRR
jgi:hypothetical protein